MKICSESHFHPGVPESPGELNRARYVFTFTSRLLILATADEGIDGQIGEANVSNCGAPEEPVVSKHGICLEKD